VEHRDDLEQYGYLAGPKGTVIDNVSHAKGKRTDCPPTTQTRSMRPTEDRTLLDKTGGLGYACNSGDERDNARRRLGAMVVLDMHGRNQNREGIIQGLTAEMLRALRREDGTPKIVAAVAAVANIAYVQALAPGEDVHGAWLELLAKLPHRRRDRLMSAAFAILESSAQEAASEGIKKTG
jgi:hypothetical protein